MFSSLACWGILSLLSSSENVNEKYATRRRRVRLAFFSFLFFSRYSFYFLSFCCSLFSLFISTGKLGKEEEEEEEEPGVVTQQKVKEEGRNKDDWREFSFSL